MGSKKYVKINNKSDKPDNIVIYENEINIECKELERELPSFLTDYFIYIKAAVLPLSRLRYLEEVKRFFEYLIESTPFTNASDIREISASDIDKIKARDVNEYLDHSRRYRKETDNGIYIFENSNKTLARKKSALSVLFRQLYRDEIIEKNISEGFNPIRLQKQSEREIKALEDNEVLRMLDIVTTGEGLTGAQKRYWKVTKYRDKAILIFFLTYGLRLQELWQLNLSSFNFQREEFKIYRKRNKESIMHLNDTTAEALRDYLINERNDEKAKKYIDDDALFLSLQHKRITKRQIRELVKKYTSLAIGTTQHNGYSPHKLRATTATSLIGRGESIYDVQLLLGHEQVTTTQLYAKHKRDVQRDLIRSLEWEKERTK